MTPENPLAVPGGALFTLRELRVSSSLVRTSAARLRAQIDLADLRTAARSHRLRMPWMTHNSLCGIVGTFAGDDKAIVYAVREWAEAFALDAVVVKPALVCDYRGKPVVDPGWAVLHAHIGGLGFTVGGRLVEAVSAR